MSRHLLIDRFDVQVVLGYDHMLRSFFGQRFNPASKRREGIAIDGWPTRSGLGTRRPVTGHAEASQDLTELLDWARRQQPDPVWDQPGAGAHLVKLLQILRREWDDGDDHADISVPACLQSRGSAAP